MKPTPSSAPCNKCGLSPKYPSQGLCRKCFLEKAHHKWVASRPEKKPIQDLPGELWLDLKEAPGYQISNLGRVKSLNYMGEAGRHYMMKLYAVRKGSYLRMDFLDKQLRLKVHRMVALYFIPNPKSYPIVLHKDDNKQNNIVSNLEWGTRSKNNKDYAKFKSENNIPRVKLSKSEVMKILRSNNTVQSISIKYNISTTTVWSIKTGRTWNAVTGLPKTRKERGRWKIKKHYD